MTEHPVDQAAHQLVEARQRLRATWGVAKHALTPRAMATRKAHHIRKRAETALRARPYAVAGTATALTLILLRKPLAGLVRRLLRTTRHD